MICYTIEDENGRVYEVPITYTPYSFSPGDRTALPALEIPHEIKRISKIESPKGISAPVYVLFIHNEVETITNFGDKAFEELLEFVVDEENPFLTSIDGVLYNKDVTELIRVPECYRNDSITIPSTVVSMREAVFYCCKLLKAVEGGIQLKEVPKDAFRGCRKLKMVNFDSTQIELIGKHAFAYCSSLEEIRLGENIKTIGDNAFENCSSLCTLSSAHNIEEIGCSAFYKCSSLKDFHFGSKISCLRRSTFEGCSELSMNSLPDTITSIGDKCFKDCISLSIEYLHPQTKIGHQSFQNTGVECITLPEKIRVVEAFSCCEKLKKVIIPYDWNIGNYMFKFCPNLTEIHLRQSKMGWICTHALKFIDYETCKLYVPKGSADFYRSADQWKDFKYIIEE